MTLRVLDVESLQLIRCGRDELAALVLVSLEDLLPFDLRAGVRIVGAKRDPGYAR
jgi:hypothetical protein